MRFSIWLHIQIGVYFVLGFIKTSEFNFIWCSSSRCRVLWKVMVIAIQSCDSNHVQIRVYFLMFSFIVSVVGSETFVAVKLSSLLIFNHKSQVDSFLNLITFCKVMRFVFLVLIFILSIHTI